MAANFERRQIERAVDDVGGKKPAKEHHLSEQKYPHAEAPGLALLFHVLKLVRKPGNMRVVNRHISHESPCCVRSRRLLRLPPESPQNFQWEAEKAWSTPALWLPKDSGPPSVRNAWTTSSR